MKKLWNKIKCWLDEHDWEICETRKERGFFFGGETDAHKWRCKNCGLEDEKWTMTESI